MSSSVMFSILTKQWANINDIKVLASCGRDSASKIRNKIIADIEKSGKHLPTSKEKLVPITSVIEYLNLDVNFILKMAEKEKTLNT